MSVYRSSHTVARASLVHVFGDPQKADSRAFLLYFQMVGKRSIWNELISKTVPLLSYIKRDSEHDMLNEAAPVLNELKAVLETMACRNHSPSEIEQKLSDIIEAIRIEKFASKAMESKHRER